MDEEVAKKLWELSEKAVDDALKGAGGNNAVDDGSGN